MSRYHVDAKDAEHFTVIVGWDNPMQTFFVQVWDLAKEEDDDEACVFWIGTHPGSVPTVTALVQAMSAYAALPGDIATQLERDQALSEPPTPLQQWMMLASTGPAGASSHV